MSDRSSRDEVRNPLLKLHSAQQIQALPLQMRQVLAVLLLELSRDARDRAQRSWRQSKAPLAAYWKVVSVYAGHLHRVARLTRTEIVALERSRFHTAEPAIKDASSEDR